MSNVKTSDDIMRYVKAFRSPTFEFSSEDLESVNIELGAVEAGIILQKEFNMRFEEIEDKDSKNKRTIIHFNPMSTNECYLCALMSYRIYAIQRHDEYAQKAINFSTKGFSMTGANERAKEWMRIVWMLDTKISKMTDIIFYNVNGYYGDVVEMRSN